MDSNKTLVTIISKSTANGDLPSNTVAPDSSVGGIETTRSYALPNPTSYSTTTTTITDGGTSVSGHLLSSTVRTDVVQISLAWNYLEASVWSEINQLFKDNYTNEVLFYDQTSNEWESREMYVSDRSAGLWRLDENGEVPGWTGCGLQLTEV